MSNGGSTALLRSLRDRIVNLEHDKADIQGDIKDVYREAKSQGFDVRALRKIVKETLQDESEKAAVAELEAVTDVYRAALGMLGGTPLGEATRRRLTPTKPPAAPANDESGGEDGEAAPELGSTETSGTTIGKAKIAEAHDKGREAFKAGIRLISNPYTASDPRRAAWDEGWCEASGTDGMDIPDAWRRKGKKKKGDDE